MSENVKYFRREAGGIVRLTDNVTVHSLNLNGQWVPNQDAISMFYDGMVDYEEITEEEMLKTAEDWKKGIFTRG